jgi:hypothetical protein
MLFKTSNNVGGVVNYGQWSILPIKYLGRILAWVWTQNAWLCDDVSVGDVIQKVKYIWSNL